MNDTDRQRTALPRKRSAASATGIPPGNGH
jgi:hypothetical protein